MHKQLSVILTGHVPYLRAIGRTPDGEDAIHETIAYALVPILNALFDLGEHGVRPTVGLAISPVLLEQLADNIVQKHFMVWMDAWLEARSQALAHWESEGDVHAAYLARFDIDWGREILRSFSERYSRNLVGALRDLCVEGAEPLAVAATHGYLPLISSPESIRTQIDLGMLGTMRWLAHQPRGIWLPECGYSPTCLSTLLLSGAEYMIVDPTSLPPGAAMTPRRIEQHFSALVRDTAASEQVWSFDIGYPGDPVYRSLHRDIETGIPLWRNGIGPVAELYDPYDAFQRVDEHAAHFAAYVAARLEGAQTRPGGPDGIVVVFDLELLGRRWFEGPMWLRTLLAEVARMPDLRLVTPLAYLHTHRPGQQVILRDGSWGEGGDHRSWGGHALPLWEAIGEAEERLAQLISQFPDARGEHERVLSQALRELLLAQSSDWALLYNQGNATGMERVTLHLEHCARLCLIANEPTLSEVDRLFLEQVEELDNPFPYLNYRVFSAV